MWLVDSPVFGGPFFSLGAVPLPLCSEIHPPLFPCFALSWKSDLCKLHFWIVLTNQWKVLAVDWKWREGQPRVFLSSFCFGQQFQHWLCLLHDSSFYRRSWLLTSVISTSFNSPAQGVLQALHVVHLWVVSLSSDRLFSFCNTFTAILQYCISSIAFSSSWLLS